MMITCLELRGSEGRATLENDVESRRLLVSFDGRPADIELFYGCDADERRRAAGVIVQEVDGAGSDADIGDCLRMIEFVLP